MIIVAELTRYKLNFTNSMADIGDGDAAEISDKRLAYIYRHLVKSWKFKIDKWETMMKTAEFNVRKMYNNYCHNL